MYKIYINGTPLYLVSSEEVKSFGPSTEKKIVLRYGGKKKFLTTLVNQLECTQRFDYIAVFDPDVERMWTEFQKIFKLISAAGGAVFNAEGKVLMIHRRGSWDLPKGKMDPGETPEQTAVREVQEETGIGEISLGPHLLDTWHTYEMNGKRILKTTYWYRMQTTENQLVPQTEEDIELAVWADLNAFLAQPNEVYGNILDVLNKAQTNK
ncbi:MAG: NUDIX hydrolase [Saprospiraceae bacterium]|nr:NUDIX hydrolase [Saprospiraceae bacterium]MCF8250456.1 NUDIX hydrolase [Saprospiraceae bacterium]MCF8282103.1 NUDIX hydrolase [Bacteroidales bacterium]MCF8312398.1 NUDIX hydrolase [Saprospiraceae bacterium]MCF8440605.1 NUDIX hydrolase [Saprospiraceae bacterium]